MYGASKDCEQEGDTSEIMETSIMEGEEYYNEEGGEWTQKVDTGQLCRVCANPNDYLIPIFDGEGLEHELGMKIQKHLPIKVTETDTLPQHMCYQCASTLIAWHDLVISCMEADKKLRELEMEENDDDDDKGAEMFESPSLDSVMTEDVIQPSTSETQNQNQVSKTPSSKKATVTKEKKSKLKMILVKGPPAGTSGQKTASKTQVAKALELAKSKDGVSQDSASERSRQHISHNAEIFGNFEDTEANYPSRADTYECNYCWTYSVTVSDLVSHLSKVHASGVHNCEVCDEKLHIIKEILVSHLAVHGVELSENEVFENCEDQVEETTEAVRETVLYIQEKPSLNMEEEKFDENNVGGKYMRCDVKLEPEQMKFHEEEHMCKKLNKCCHCEKLCRSPTEIKNHERNHIGEQPFECKYCGVRFVSASDLFKHAIYHKNNVLLTCNICSQVFQKTNDLENHLSTHKNNKIYLCHVCGMSFKEKSALNNHTCGHKKNENRKAWMCDICGKAFRSHRNLKNHQLLHTGVKQFICDKCGKSFFNLQSLNIHLHSHSEVRPFQCPLCEQRFRWLKNLKVHAKTHVKDDEKKSGTKVQCVVCNKHLSSKDKLKAHMRCHSDEHPFSCFICEKRFRQKASLNYHMKTVHDASMDFECGICGKLFPSRQSHDNHRLFHTGERPYKCNTCSKLFRSVYSLRSHTKIHLDIRPYPCTYCGKSFRKKSQLDCHVRIHTGEKPFICEKCGRSFTQKWAMIKHKEIHK